MVCPKHMDSIYFYQPNYKNYLMVFAFIFQIKIICINVVIYKKSKNLNFALY